MKKTWMPKVAGSLSILAGVINLLSAFLLALGAFIAQGVFSYFAVPFWMPLNASVILFALGFPLLVCGILSVLGGVYAMQRKKWSLALTGSILAFFPYCFLGLASTVLIALAKDEFEPAYQPTPVSVNPGA